MGVTRLPSEDIYIDLVKRPIQPTGPPVHLLDSAYRGVSGG